MYSWQRFFSHPVGYLCWVFFLLLCKRFIISWCLTCNVLGLFPVILESLSESFCLCLYLKETQDNKHLYSMNSRDGLFGFLGFDLPQLLLALYYIAICSVTLSSDLMQYRQEAYPAGIYGYLLKCGPCIFLQQLHNLIQLNYFLFSMRVTNLLYLIHSFPSTICVCFALLLKIKWL